MTLDSLNFNETNFMIYGQLSSHRAWKKIDASGGVGGVNCAALRRAAKMAANNLLNFNRILRFRRIYEYLKEKFENKSKTRAENA